mgnify:CR=1 FL=1
MKMNEGFTKEEILKEFEENEFRICEGNCAKCDNDDIDYLESGIEGEEYYYTYECVKCEHIGKEWYSLTYIETR